MDKLSVSLGKVLGVKIWAHKIFQDQRGMLSKAYVYDSKEFGGVLFDTYEHFFTYSNLNVFRGMHLQVGIHPSAKIVSIVSGSATDYLLDLRTESETFGYLQIEHLRGVEPKSIYIPEGVAHGYISESEGTIFSYRYNLPFCQKCDSGINPLIIQKYLHFNYVDMVSSKKDKELTSDIDAAVHKRFHL